MRCRVSAFAILLLALPAAAQTSPLPSSPSASAVGTSAAPAPPSTAAQEVPTIPPSPPATGPAGPPPTATQEPLPPLTSPTARRHDGFYLRMGIGFGYGQAKSEANVAGIGNIEATFKGSGPAYELLIGGTVGKAIVIGGGFVGQDISSPQVRMSPDVLGLNGNVSANGALGIGVLGPFIDWFPDVNGGAHFGAMLGIGVIGLRDENDDPDTGPGASIWGGYDFWIADQWSLGAEARAAVASAHRHFSDINQDFRDSASTFELLFSALYH